MEQENLIDITKVSDKGQVVIPKEIRDKLGLTEGSKLIVIAAENAVVLQKIELVSGGLKIKRIVERVRELREKLALGKSE